MSKALDISACGAKPRDLAARGARWLHFRSLLLRILTWGAAALTALVMAFLIGYILFRGVPNLHLSLFAWTYTTENVSMTPAIFNTVILVALALIVAVPLGVGSAIYLVEYAPRKSPLVKVIRMTTETLSGIPSIVYGLFGFLMFGVALKWGYCILSGALTLAIMVLPLIMRTTEEALLSVPDLFREGSFGLGAGRVRTVFSIVLPAAMPGILSGVILAIGRIVGETAALIFTAGTTPKVPGFSAGGGFFSTLISPLMRSGRTLAVHMYALLNEGLYTNQAYATAVVLLAVVIGINALSGVLARRLSKG